VLFAGDAVAATDPLTGEGIGQALLTGILAAGALLDAGPGKPGDAAARYDHVVDRALVADHRMSVLLQRAIRNRRGAEVALRISSSTAWTRRNFVRWLFEDEPRAVAFTPRRWHRGFLRRPGAFTAGIRGRNGTSVP